MQISGPLDHCLSSIRMIVITNYSPNEYISNTVDPTMVLPSITMCIGCIKMHNGVIQCLILCPATKPYVGTGTAYVGIGSAHLYDN